MFSGGFNMKNKEKLPTIIWETGLFMLFSSIAFVLYILLNIFMKYSISNNYIWGICIFVIISFFQLIMNRGWRHVSEISARFLLDSLPGRQMEIEAELNSGNITEDDAKKKKYELQKKIDLVNSVDGCTGFFSRISKIITISLICIAIIFLTINGLKLFIIDNKYIMAIIIYGIVSELIFIVIQLYTTIIITKTMK
jgi:flagellar biosynthesis protein FlhA